jgi:hypothetical protein
VAVALLPLFACGGPAKGKSYEKALSKQEKCCQALADAQARSTCQDSIIRIDDPEAKDTAVNEATFACVEEHFACDSSTGRATKEASQKAYDCIAALEER